MESEGRGRGEMEGVRLRVKGMGYDKMRHQQKRRTDESGGEVFVVVGIGGR